MRLNHYAANIDAHTENNAPLCRITDCKFMNTGLELHSSSNRFDGSRKLRQEAVAGILHDAAAMFRNRGLDTISEEHSQFCMRSLFVIVHEPPNSQPRQRPISPITCARSDLAAFAPWLGIQSRGHCTTDKPPVPNALMDARSSRMSEIGPNAKSRRYRTLSEFGETGPLSDTAILSRLPPCGLSG